MAYSEGMPKTRKTVRQSVSLPSSTARKVKALAKAQPTSASRVLVDLIEVGLDSKDQEKRHYLGLVEQLAASADPEERQRMKEELARLTFG
jgi:hypothetical protein